MKNIRIFYLKIFVFLVVNVSVYLNRHVFVIIPADVVFAHIFNTYIGVCASSVMYYCCLSSPNLSS